MITLKQVEVLQDFFTFNYLSKLNIILNLDETWEQHVILCLRLSEMSITQNAQVLIVTIKSS